MSAAKYIANEIDISALLNAQKSFKDGFANASTELERDGVIRRFEIVYELVWRTLKRILVLKGFKTTSQRDIFLRAAQLNLIEDPTNWFDFLKKRRLTNLIYDRSYAEKIYASLPLFNKELDKIVRAIAQQ